MQQLDMLDSSIEDFLYREIQKTKKSMDKRSRAVFALIGELQDEIIKLNEIHSSSQTKEK